MRFVWFSYHKTANRITPCGIVRCGYAILWVVLVRFLRLVRFSEHPYLLESLGIEIYHIGERN